MTESRPDPAAGDPAAPRRRRRAVRRSEVPEQEIAGLPADERTENGDEGRGLDWYLTQRPPHHG